MVFTVYDMYGNHILLDSQNNDVLEVVIFNRATSEENYNEISRFELDHV